MIAIYISGYYPESMNIMRQFFAVALIFFGSYFLQKNKVLLFLPFLFVAINMHTSSIVGILLLFVYFWNKEECNWKKKSILLFVMVPITYVGFSKVKDAYEIYAKYFEIVKQNIGFMLAYKISAVSLVGYVSKCGLIRRGVDIVGKNKMNENVVGLYLIGLLLCSLGSFFPFVDRIGLYFLMFEMPFWGWAIRASEMSIPYRIFCYVFIVYLYAMNLLTDGHQIFPYKTIFGV